MKLKSPNMTDTWKIPNIWVWYTCLSSVHWKLPSSHLCYPAVLPWSERQQLLRIAQQKISKNHTNPSWMMLVTTTLGGWPDSTVAVEKQRMMVINNPLVRPFFLGVALGGRPQIPIMISVPFNYWLELTRGIVPNICWPSNPSNLPLRAPCSMVVHARQNCEHFCTWWESKVMVSLTQTILQQEQVSYYTLYLPPPLRMSLASKG